ncbi:MAG: ribonuclease E/G [Rickettsiales bacterium]|jgi:ribonuclease E|nr:ribonuclease E/G [Rickettsiales bacterium]
MNKKMYIDAVFPDETRVVLVGDKNIIEYIDRETPSIKQLKGNIYLAKIIRLEPSLQSAFINYGGDRHGFLPFSDVHPDYYNIPENKKNDLTAVKFFNTLLAEDDLTLDSSYNNSIGDEEEQITEATSDDFEEENYLKLSQDNEVVLEENEEEVGFLSEDIMYKAVHSDEKIGISNGDIENKAYYNEYRKHKIENVLKEGQSLLVQVLKEERGNKGVALTTYISIAGKYSVLMSNVEYKGGISKKITNLYDRKVLKEVLNTINPGGKKSIILRTAAIGKKPGDILRDYVYLDRLWKAIKQESLKQTAPAFIHSEDDILKRSIRDTLNDKVSEIVVAGKEAFKTIKTLTALMAPEQKVIIKEYDEKIPLFYKMGIEEQVLQLYDNRINLPSGGSIVIDQTEALVAIDVNSGKATKQGSVEEMAVATNLEAIKEIARQLQLRDIGGLIVIDFIDMDNFKNRRLVEKAMRDALVNDKARVQMDKISIFGLMEVSRQRINASFGERISEKCSVCEGKGSVRSKYIVGENILRNIKYCARDKNFKVFTVESTKQMIEYLLNYKRDEIKKIEKDFDINIIMFIDPEKTNNGYNIEKRENLTALEKMDLFPVQNVGVVNELFKDSDFYDNYEDDIGGLELENTHNKNAKKPITYNLTKHGSNLKKSVQNPNNRKPRNMERRDAATVITTASRSKKSKQSILGKILKFFK